MTRVRRKFKGFVTVGFWGKAAGSQAGWPRAGGLGAAQHAGDADVFVDLRPVHPHGHEFDAGAGGGGGVQQARIPPQGRGDGAPGGEGDGEVLGVAVGGGGAADLGGDLRYGSTPGIQQAIQQLLAGVKPDVAFGMGPQGLFAPAPVIGVSPLDARPRLALRRVEELAKGGSGFGGGSFHGSARFAVSIKIVKSKRFVQGPSRQATMSSKRKGRHHRDCPHRLATKRLKL